MSASSEKASGDLGTMLGCAIAAVSVPAFLAVAALIEGAVIVRLWRWFVEPLGMPAITLAHAIGISMLVGFMTHQVPQKNRQTDESLKARGWWIWQTIVQWPRTALAVGYVAHRFVP